jgi:hypothetical protein
MVQSTIFSTIIALVRTVAVVILLSVASGPSAVAQDRATAPPEPSELIGAKVFTASGSEVGEVAAVTVSPNGEIDEMRMNAASPLGIGQRTVVLPLESLMVLRGAVVLDLSPSEVDLLPNAPEGSLKNPTKL